MPWPFRSSRRAAAVCRLAVVDERSHPALAQIVLERGHVGGARLGVVHHRELEPLVAHLEPERPPPCSRIPARSRSSPCPAWRCRISAIFASSGASDCKKRLQSVLVFRRVRGIGGFATRRRGRWRRRAWRRDRTRDADCRLASCAEDRRPRSPAGPPSAPRRAASLIHGS